MIADIYPIVLCVEEKEKKRDFINKKRETAILRPDQCRYAQLTDELEKQRSACVPHTEEVLFWGVNLAGTKQATTHTWSKLIKLKYH